MKPGNLEIVALVKKKVQWMDDLWTGTIFLNIKLELDSKKKSLSTNMHVFISNIE